MIAQLILGFCLVTCILFLILAYLSCNILCRIIGIFTRAAPLNIFAFSAHRAKVDKVYKQSYQPINKECFICFQKMSTQVVATCNHSFCGQCIINYIQINNNNHIRCPACRKDILVLFRRFNPRNDSQKKIKQAISTYNYKYTKQPSVLRSITQFGNTISNMSILFNTPGLTHIFGDVRFLYLVIFAIYTISPFDFLPEALLGPIGLLDDGVVIASMIRQVSLILYGFVRDERRRQRALPM